MKTLSVIKGVKITEIIGNLPEYVSFVTDSSEKVKTGSLFFVRKGNNYDGKDYIEDAVKNGATVVVGEEYFEGAPCFIKVENSDESMTAILDNFYSSPQKKLKIIGVVGTNGKTSVCHIIASILSNCGIKTGIIGTIGVYYDGKKRDISLTTPGRFELYEYLSKMVKAKVEVVVMEVSAHAIAQNRTDGIYFEELIFTNCTEDHLDYFKTFKEYSKVKKSIFKKENAKYLIVNADDESGEEIIKENAEVFSYGLYNPSDVFAIDIEESFQGTTFYLNLLDYVTEVRTKLLGEYNVYNSLASLTGTSLLGVSVKRVVCALEQTPPVKGRCEKVGEINGGIVFLDYAHTPDGLLKTLETLRKICTGKLYSLFGCGGNRETQKREIMGGISALNADFTIITDDNPRFENAETIRGEIEKGVLKQGGKYVNIEGRKNAIKYGVSLLTKGDVLLVAGKGEESYQEIMGKKYDYSDRKEIEKTINEINSEASK